MTQNQNAGLLFFSFFVFMRWGRWAGLGRARGGVGKGVGAIVIIYDPLYQPNRHCFTFS